MLETFFSRKFRDFCSLTYNLQKSEHINANRGVRVINASIKLEVADARLKLIIMPKTGLHTLPR
jgi:hypothetical protein